MHIAIDGWAWLPLSEMREDQRIWLQRQLTLANVSRRDPLVLECFETKPGRLGIPRGYLQQNITKDHTFRCFAYGGDDDWPERADPPKGAVWAFRQDDDDVRALTLVDSFSGSDDFLTSNQQKGVDVVMHELAAKEWGQGIVNFHSPQSAAKVCAALIQKLRIRTLVLTLKGHGVSLWQTVLGRFMPDAKVGVIENDEPVDVHENHVTLSTVEEIRDALEKGQVGGHDFGFVISDQIQLLDPVVWSSVTPNLHAARRLGIATNGADVSSGLGRSFSYHLGPWIFSGESDLLVPRIRRVWSGWSPGIYSRINPEFISRGSVVDTMCSNAVYNGHVVDQIIQAMEAGRRVVVFSEKLAHLKTLKAGIESKWSGTMKIVDYVVSGMAPSDISSAVTADVVLTLYSEIALLPEIPAVDTVVLSTPTRDPAPAIRVCLTRDAGKKEPVVVDVRCDAFPVCREYGDERDLFYRSQYGERSK